MCVNRMSNYRNMGWKTVLNKSNDNLGTVHKIYQNWMNIRLIHQIKINCGSDYFLFLTPINSPTL